MYKTLSARRQVNLVTGMNVCGAGLPFILALNALKVIPALSNAVILFILTLWGVCWSLPFYLPPGIVALRLGGKEHSALLTNVFDGAGFALAAVYSIFAMKLGRKGDWCPIMLALSAFGLISTVTMRHAMNTEESQKVEF